MWMQSSLPMILLARNHLSLPYFELPSSNALARRVSSYRLLVEIQTRPRDHLDCHSPAGCSSVTDLPGAAFLRIMSSKEPFPITHTQGFHHYCLIICHLFTSDLCILTFTGPWRKFRQKRLKWPAMSLLQVIPIIRKNGFPARLQQTSAASTFDNLKTIPKYQQTITSFTLSHDINEREFALSEGISTYIRLPITALIASYESPPMIVLRSAYRSPV